MGPDRQGMAEVLRAKPMPEVPLAVMAWIYGMLQDRRPGDRLEPSRNKLPEERTIF